MLIKFQNSRLLLYILFPFSYNVIYWIPLRLYFCLSYFISSQSAFYFLFYFLNYIRAKNVLTPVSNSYQQKHKTNKEHDLESLSPYWDVLNETKP